MNVIELLNSSSTLLKDSGITNPKTSSELLLAHVLGIERLDLYLDHDRRIKAKEIERFNRLCARRLEHEPIEYILGNTEFMSLPFMVNKHVLIPRPETELLIEKILLFCANDMSGESITIVDIGTGAGNISVSLAHYIAKARVTAVDISQNAVDVAEKNSRKNGVERKITFVVKDVFDMSAEDFSELQVIVSNPPYVDRNSLHFPDKDVVDYEPHIALFAGDNNLRFFETIAGLAQSWLTGGGLLCFETGYDTGAAVKKIVERSGFKSVSLEKDYSGIDRIVTGIRV
jgi:release factor glutamine methyltransferase